MIRQILVFLVVAVTFASECPTAAAAPSAKEAKAVEHLLQYIEKSPHRFLVSGEEYDAAHFSAMVRQRYETETSRILTAEDFIDRAASRTLSTGRRYIYQRSDGSQSEVKGWLATELKKYRDEHPF